jgi:acetyl-CoA carboxylase biotin carboxyl carrier protein
MKGGTMLPDEKEIMYSLTYKEMLEILKIIDESPCRELRLELDGFKLEIIKGGESPHLAGGVSSVPASPPSPSSPPPGAAKSREEPAAKIEKKEGGAAGAITPLPSEGPLVSGVEVKSPLAGTFYRAPTPGARPFVEVGATVDAGEQVAIVEVMKLMNSIKAPVKGIVRKILAENDTIVKMGQTLMIIEPV